MQKLKSRSSICKSHTPSTVIYCLFVPWNEKNELKFLNIMVKIKIPQISVARAIVFIKAKSFFKKILLLHTFIEDKILFESPQFLNIEYPQWEEAPQTVRWTIYHEGKKKRNYRNIGEPNLERRGQWSSDRYFITNNNITLHGVCSL